MKYFSEREKAVIEKIFSENFGEDFLFGNNKYHDSKRYDKYVDLCKNFGTERQLTEDDLKFILSLVEDTLHQELIMKLKARLYNCKINKKS